MTTLAPTSMFSFRVKLDEYGLTPAQAEALLKLATGESLSLNARKMMCQAGYLDRVGQLTERGKTKQRIVKRLK